MRVLTGHTKPIKRLAYRRDGRLLASAGWDGFVRLWDPISGEARGLIGCGEERHALSVAFSPDGNTLAVGYGPNKGMVQIWKLKPLERLEEWSGQGRSTRTAEFSPDGRMLATGGSDDNVYLWGLTGLVKRCVMHVPRTGITRLAYSPDGKYLAVLDSSGRVAFWLLSPMGIPAQAPWLDDGADLSNKADHDLAFLPDSRTAILGLSRGLMSMRPGRSGAIFWPAPGAVRAVSVSPDGRSLLAADEDGIITLWDVPTRTVRRRLDWRMGDIVSVTFAPDGLTAAAGGNEGFVLIWDMDE